jgi:hypothetical protein
LPAPPPAAFPNEWRTLSFRVESPATISGTYASSCGGASTASRDVAKELLRTGFRVVDDQSADVLVRAEVKTVGANRMDTIDILLFVDDAVVERATGEGNNACGGSLPEMISDAVARLTHPASVTTLAERVQAAPKKGEVRKATAGAAPSQGPALALAKATSLLVLDLKGMGQLPNDVPRSLTKMLLATLDPIGNLRTVSTDDVQAMLNVEKQKDLIGCTTTACMAEIGGALGTDVVLYGEISRIGSRYSVTMSLVSSGKAQVLGRVSAVTDANEDALIAALPQITRDIVSKLGK